MLVRVKLYRNHESLFKEFDLVLEPSHTVLDLLYTLKEKYDPTLSFRSMCRAGICGTCGVKVNAKPVLACKTKIAELEEPITIEPLDNLPLIKDLVVDHSVLIERLKRLKVWYEPIGNNLQVFRTNPLVDKSFECIACGLCDASCPVFLTNQEFGGPMSFLRIYKLTQDLRNSRREDSLLRVKDGHVQLCTHCKNCSIICPLGLMPESIIKFEEVDLTKRGLISQNLPNSFDFF
ncbi:succinate dehydrogenase/fumarate reductase iron-sulfur subunit [Thermocrinis sp.]